MYYIMWRVTLPNHTLPPLLSLLAFYRSPAGGNPSGKNYETNGWFFADDAIANLWKNRFVITMPLLGMPVSPVHLGRMFGSLYNLQMCM